MEQSGSSSRQEEERDLRAALQYAVANICAQEDANDTSDAGTTMSRSAVKALVELTYQYATTSLSNDLVWFSRHANRRTITVDDVKLVARKNPNHLLSRLESFTEEQKLARGVHTMEKVRQEMNQSKPPKKQRKASSPKSRSTESTATQAETRRKEIRARILKQIHGNDESSDESIPLYQTKDMDVASDDSDSPLERTHRHLKSGISRKEKRPKDMDQNQYLEDSDSSVDINTSHARKRLKKASGSTKESSFSTFSRPKSDDNDSLGLSDSDHDSSSLVDRDTRNKENAVVRETNHEVIELGSQEFEY